jgi:L-threonylcarbamoyladenylate synthase
VSCHEYFSRFLGGDGSSVGLRIPNDPLLRRLLEITGPLATTSANISGLPSLTSVPEFIEQLALEPWPKSHRVLFELGISVMVGGGAPSGKSSTVVDLRGGTLEIIRQGEVQLFRILEALGQVD